MDLRPYQLDAVERIRDAIRAGKKNILLCAPTGSGKTIIAAFLVSESHKKTRRSAFICDRVNLIDQTSATFDAESIPHGVMQAQHWRFKPWERVQVCSAQTLARRAWPEADLIIVDECHTISQVVKDKIAKRETITIGLTATPFTKGLGKLYDALVNVTTTNILIKDGFLSQYRIFAPSAPNMEGVKVVAGEWEEKEASKRAMEVVGDCVVEYLKHGGGKKFICSAVDVAHVEELHRQFMSAGVMCSTYTYKVKDEERAEIVREFRKPDSYIRGLITVTAASKGFDVPDIGVVIMARPLRKSLAEHIQFFGRGLRIHPSKSECLVLDHSGNSERFWDEWNEFFQHGALALDDGKKKEKPALKPKDDADRPTKCPKCAHLHRSQPFCPACGHTYPPKESVKHVAGSLAELVSSGDKSAMSESIWPQVVGYALKHRPAAYAEKYALATYKQMTGQWPDAKFADTPPKYTRKEVKDKINALNDIYREKLRAEKAAQASGAPA